MCYYVINTRDELLFDVMYFWFQKIELLLNSEILKIIK
jgi:hypothetical protein